MRSEGLRELYVDELKDLYSAENQLIKALPKMAKAASSEELRQGFEEHLEQTKGQVQRLEKIFESLEGSPKGKKCVGMEGLVQEGAEVMEEDFEDSVMTLQEEKETDEKLNELAREINAEANEQGDDHEQEQSRSRKKGSKRVA
jgi:ferritin-like metal-binding protein YciE